MPNTMCVSLGAEVTIGAVWHGLGISDCEYIATVVYPAVYDSKAMDAR